MRKYERYGSKQPKQTGISSVQEINKTLINLSLNYHISEALHDDRCNIKQNKTKQTFLLWQEYKKILSIWHLLIRFPFRIGGDALNKKGKLLLRLTIIKTILNERDFLDISAIMIFSICSIPQVLIFLVQINSAYRRLKFSLVFLAIMS